MTQIRHTAREFVDGRWAVFAMHRCYEVCVGLWPYGRIACHGGADEHVQLFASKDDEMPTHIVVNGLLLEHPDAP